MFRKKRGRKDDKQHNHASISIRRNPFCYLTAIKKAFLVEVSKLACVERGPTSDHALKGPEAITVLADVKRNRTIMQKH